MTTALDFKLDFKLGELTVTSKGAKQIPVTTKAGSPLIWMPNEALSVCYSLLPSTTQTQHESIYVWV